MSAPTSTDLAAHPEVFRAHSAQLQGMADHLGHARILNDLGLTQQALAEVQLVQAQLRYLATIERGIEAMGVAR